MDLLEVTRYLRPTQREDVAEWQPGWSWLAGGTWLFSEPQPQVTTLVDMQRLGWSELDATPQGLAIGATCTMSELLRRDYTPEWTGVQALHAAVRELASFKVQNMATVAGNVCLALPAGTFAPALMVLGASYEIWPRQGEVYRVPAGEFQLGARSTILQPGDVLRHIWIPAEHLAGWRTNYQRICVASAGIAVTIVVAAYHPQLSRLRLGISGSLPAPQLLEFTDIPDDRALNDALDAHISSDRFLDDSTASATYRRHVTQVLAARARDAVS